MRGGAGDVVRQRGEGARGGGGAGALRHRRDRDQGVGSRAAPVRGYGEARESGGGGARRGDQGGAVVPRRERYVVAARCGLLQGEIGETYTRRA